jgi:DNA polymerase-1
MLRKLMLDYDPKHIAVIFDCKEKTFRHDMFVDYKANRAVMPAELAPQIQPLHEIIRAMGLPLIAVPGVEADDVIGTLALQASEAGMFTVISTGDKDMAQLVNDNIILVNTMSGSIYDRAGVLKKFEVAPEQIIDYLSLIGDSVDNIPGVAKVGPKTAVKWLQTYHSLDNVMAHSHDITGKVGENLREALPHLPLYKELIKIKLDVELDQHPRDLVRGAQNVEKLQELYARMEFRTWLKQLGEQQPIAAPRHIEPAKPSNYELILDKDHFAKWLKKLSQAKCFTFDTETTSVNYMDAKLVGISFAVEAGHAAYVPLAHDYEGAPEQLTIDYVLDELKPLLENPQQMKITHHLKYDMEIMANYNLKILGNCFDTMLASYVINSVASRHNMEALALEYLNKPTISFEDVAGKGAKQLTFNQINLEQAAPYAAEDADVTFQLYEEFSAKLVATPSLYAVYSQIEMPLVPVLAAVERRGVLIDTRALEQQSAELGAELHKLEQMAFTLAGQEFNLGSPKQLQEILFEKLQLPILERTPTGQPSTGEPVLQELAHSYELPKIILEHRSLSKLKSTYTDKLPLQVNAITGRVHTSYHQAVTATGRLSSSDPNLQNIPMRSIAGKRIRSAFIAPPGYKIISLDYSQIELRIMAHLSGDQTLLDTFAQGLDVHTATASEVFGVPKDQVSEEQRRNAKAINFGLIYGMSAFGLAKQIGSDRLTAEIYIDTYFQRFPGVKVFMDTTRKLAAEQGYVETLFGRRLYLPDIRSNRVPLKRAAERAAINAPMQGAQADIIKRAMIEIFAWMQKHAPDAHMIMQVHDELVFEIPEAKVAEYSKHIAHLMETAADLSVKLEVGVGVGDNWEAAH